MIINIRKEGGSRPAADPVDAPLAVNGATEEAGDPGGDLDHASAASPEMSPPADGTQSSGIRLRDMRGGGGSSLLAQRLKGYDSLTRRIIVSAEREMRAYASPAELSRTRSAAAEASRLFGDMQRMDRTFGAFGGLLSGASEIAGLQSHAFRDLEMIKSAAASVAEAAGVRDELTKTFQDVQICLGHYDRATPDTFFGVGPGSSIQRQRSFIESLLCGGDYGIQWAVREAEVLKRLLGGIQGHAEWSLMRDSLEMMRDLPRDFGWAEALQPYDTLQRESWVKAAGEPWIVLPAPFLRPEPGADRLAGDQPAPCVETPASAIVEPGSANLHRAVLLEIAQQCGWDPDRLLRVLAEMRGARVEMARPAPERDEPRAPTKSRRSHSGGVRGGVVIRDQGGAFEISFRGMPRHFGKLHGLEILKILTDHPDQFISCLDLRHDSAAASIPRVFVGENEAAARRYGLAEGYDRAKELVEDIEEADARSDWRRKAELEEQQDELIRQFMAEKGERGGVPGQRLPSLGPHGSGGKRRLKKKVSPELDKARKAVRAAVQYAYGVIRKELPELEGHFRERVDTGFFCRYRKIGEKI